MFYVVRVQVDKLPQHPFRAKGVDWNWVRTRAKLRPEAISWSQRPETQPTPSNVAELLRRSQMPLPIRETLRAPTPLLAQLKRAPVSTSPNAPRSFGEARAAWGKKSPRHSLPAL